MSAFSTDQMLTHSPLSCQVPPIVMDFLNIARYNTRTSLHALWLDRLGRGVLSLTVQSVDVSGFNFMSPSRPEKSPNGPIAPERWGS